MDENIPLLIHAGYHKTASSWFQEELFNKHDKFQIIWDELKIGKNIVHKNSFKYDPKKVRNELITDIKAVQKRGVIPVLSSERLTGNPHSGGYDSNQIVERLSQTFPEAKILYNIREQVSMICSCYKQYVKIGGVASLEDYLRSDSYRSRYPSFRWDYFEYHHLIKKYRSLFGRRNVAVFPFEAFVYNKKSYLDKLRQFLPKKINFNGVNVDERKNTSLSEQSTFLLRILNSPFEVPALNRYSVFPFPYAKQIRRRVRRALGVIDPVVGKLPQLKKISERVEKQMPKTQKESYIHSNRATSDLLDLELETLGYIV